MKTVTNKKRKTGSVTSLNKTAKPFDLKSYISDLRSSGASEVTLPDGTVIKFHVEQSVKKLDSVPDATADELIKPESIFDQYTEDEILFWSTDYYDDIQARKEARAAADKEKLGE